MSGPLDKLLKRGKKVDKNENREIEELKRVHKKELEAEKARHKAFKELLKKNLPYFKELQRKAGELDGQKDVNKQLLKELTPLRREVEKLRKIVNNKKKLEKTLGFDFKKFVKYIEESYKLIIKLDKDILILHRSTCKDKNLKGYPVSEKINGNLNKYLPLISMRSADVKKVLGEMRKLVVDEQYITTNLLKIEEYLDEHIHQFRNANLAHFSSGIEGLIETALKNFEKIDDDQVVENDLLEAIARLVLKMIELTLEIVEYINKIYDDILEVQEMRNPEYGLQNLQNAIPDLGIINRSHDDIKMLVWQLFREILQFQSTQDLIDILLRKDTEIQTTLENKFGITIRSSFSR